MQIIDKYIGDYRFQVINHQHEPMKFIWDNERQTFAIINKMGTNVYASGRCAGENGIELKMGLHLMHRLEYSLHHISLNIFPYD